MGLGLRLGLGSGLGLGLVRFGVGLGLGAGFSGRVIDTAARPNKPSQVGFGAVAVHSNPAAQVVVVVAVPVRVDMAIDQRTARALLDLDAVERVVAECRVLQRAAAEDDDTAPCGCVVSGEVVVRLGGEVVKRRVREAE